MTRACTGPSQRLVCCGPAVVGGGCLRRRQTRGGPGAAEAFQKDICYGTPPLTLVVNVPFPEDGEDAGDGKEEGAGEVEPGAKDDGLLRAADVRQVQDRADEEQEGAAHGAVGRREDEGLR